MAILKILAALLMPAKCALREICPALVENKRQENKTFPVLCFFFVKGRCHSPHKGVSSVHVLMHH